MNEAMETKVTTLEAQWQSYRDACYPPKNGKLDPLQETETRQAFYAGCLIAGKVILESSIHMTEEQACRNIQTLIEQALTVCRERVYEMKGRN